MGQNLPISSFATKLKCTHGIHGLPILSNGARLWGNVLGSPSPYGCILMDLKDGQELYRWAPEGVIVEINP